MLTTSEATVAYDAAGNTVNVSNIKLGLDDTGIEADTEVTDAEVEAFRAIELKDGSNGDKARVQIRALVQDFYDKGLVPPQVWAIYQALAVDQVTR